MKNIITLITATLLATGIYSQTPQKMSYQAVVRDATDNLVTNTTVGMQISILQHSATGTSVELTCPAPVPQFILKHKPPNRMQMVWLALKLEPAPWLQVTLH